MPQTLEEIERLKRLKALKPEGTVYTNESLEKNYGRGDLVYREGPIGLGTLIKGQPPKATLEDAQAKYAAGGTDVNLSALYKDKGETFRDPFKPQTETMTLEQMGGRTVYSPERVKSLEEAYDWTLEQIKKSTVMGQVNRYTELAGQLGEELRGASSEYGGVRTALGEEKKHVTEAKHVGLEEKFGETSEQKEKRQTIIESAKAAFDVIIAGTDPTNPASVKAASDAMAQKRAEIQGQLVIDGRVFSPKEIAETAKQVGMTSEQLIRYLKEKTAKKRKIMQQEEE